LNSNWIQVNAGNNFSTVSLMYLPLLIFPCTIKSRSSLLPPAHLGVPRKRAVKRLCVCEFVCIIDVSLAVQTYAPQTMYASEFWIAGSFRF